MSKGKNGQDVAGFIPERSFAFNAKAGKRDDGESETFIPLAFDTTQITSRANYSNPKPGDPSHPLAESAHAPTIAFRTAGNCGPFEQGDKVAALNTATDPNQNILQQGYAVRRLTPAECARLQGFQSNWCDIQFKGKPATDGHKYKAYGNSMAVPVVRWIGQQILLAEKRSKPPTRR